MALDLALAGVEDREALDFYFLGGWSRACGWRGCWGAGKTEAVDGVVAYFFEEVDGVFEVAVSLAGEAYDDVRGERDVALGGFRPGYAL